ncbi:septum formation initiator family protein [Nocardia sp. CNY236]|uniref:FtsB family cell division protein n=1 Tax=Nocardia sp. CNY236 TaxID=1169152 RepID=UPI00048CCB9C|nr:septum formation initiator family protein [Nocardia sp. CNY236]
MTERRARGTSPAGREDRRQSRAARSRPADAAGTRARRRSEAADRQPGARRSEPRATVRERTVLGLSTGKAVIFAMVVCALALTLAVPMRTYLSQRAEAARLEQHRQELEADLARLRDRRVQQQDPAYIRAEARDRLRLVMPGETPYIVQVPGIEAPPPSPAPTKVREPDPWYTELWRDISEPRSTAEPAPSPPEGPR